MIKAEAQENSIDLAVRFGGDVESLFGWLADNGLTLNDAMSPGLELSSPTVTKDAVPTYFNERLGGRRIVTGEVVASSGGSAFSDGFNEAFA